MTSIESATDICTRLIERACANGADSADAVHNISQSQSVSVRLGRLEDVARSEDIQIGLRVFVGQRTASINVSHADDGSLAELAERAVAMARAAPEDRFARLAEPDMLAAGSMPDCDLVDPVTVSPEQLRRAAEEAEDAGRAHAGITNSDGAGLEAARTTLTLVTSNGFAGSYGSTSHGISCSLVGGAAGAMERDYEYRTARHFGDLPEPGAIGAEAARRTLARLGAGKLRSGTMAVVFDPRVGNSLVGHLLAAMSGASAARRETFLLDRLGDDLFDPALSIVEDPLRKRGLRSRPFDGEGLPVRHRVLMADGRVTGWLTNLAAAAQLGVEPTGHAVRSGAGGVGIGTGNVSLIGGSQSRAELIGDIAHGVFVTELSGQGVNPMTGDYSRGAAGFRIENGNIGGPVSEFTIAGNLTEMFRALRAADDLEDWRAVNAPTVRIDAMAVAGE